MNKTLRPTTSKVLEALFSMINQKVEDSIFLDLFAGTGAIGFEALRKNASHVVFCDKSKLFVSLLRDKINKNDWKNKSSVYYGDATVILKKLKWKFDLVFLDPPYKSNLGEKTISLIMEKKLLSDEGWIIIEHHHKNFPHYPEDILELFKQKSYGETRLSFFKYKREDSGI